MDAGRSAPCKHWANPRSSSAAAELPTDGAQASRYKAGKDEAKGAQTTLLSLTGEQYILWSSDLVNRNGIREAPGKSSSVLSPVRFSV